MAMAYVYEGANFADQELCNKVADIFMFLLPGIVIGLLDVSKGDVKQGHRITAVS